MAADTSYLSILNKFGFELPPVGVKYLKTIPAGLPKLDRQITLCEMLKNAQEGNAFYADVQNHTCEAGMHVLGQIEDKEQFISGKFGAGLEVFNDPAAASNVYKYISTFKKGTIQCIALAPINLLTFEPDVLIILSNINQTEILLRAMSYNTGEMWSGNYSSVIGCSWLFAYPYLNNKINFIATGLGFGMKRRKLFPDGLHIISIPSGKLQSLMKTLQEMPWTPAPYGSDGAEFVKKLRIKLGLDHS